MSLSPRKNGEIWDGGSLPFSLPQDCLSHQGILSPKLPPKKECLIVFNQPQCHRCDFLVSGGQHLHPPRSLTVLTAPEKLLYTLNRKGSSSNNHFWAMINFGGVHFLDLKGIPNKKSDSFAIKWTWEGLRNVPQRPHRKKPPSLKKQKDFLDEMMLLRSNQWGFLIQKCLASNLQNELQKNKFTSCHLTQLTGTKTRVLAVSDVYYSWWLNQPIWKICNRQMRSWNPKFAGWKFKKMFETTTCDIIGTRTAYLPTSFLKFSRKGQVLFPETFPKPTPRTRFLSRNRGCTAGRTPNKIVPFMELTVRTWKLMVGIQFSFWDGLFSGANC